MPATQVSIVLFDLGGVLVDFGAIGPLRELSGADTDDEVWARWLACEAVRRFESGRSAPDEFARELVHEWSLAIGPEDFLDSFRNWPATALPGAEELVRAVHQVVPTGLLSNSNSLHFEDNLAAWSALDAFDYRLLSFELGAVKPDRELFEAVALALPSPRHEVLFLDDNLVNVVGAKAAGFEAVQVKGVTQARLALIDAGVLPAA